LIGHFDDPVHFSRVQALLGVDVFYHNADVIHTLDRHDVSLTSNDTVTAAAAAMNAMSRKP